MLCERSATNWCPAVQQSPLYYYGTSRVANNISPTHHSILKVSTTQLAKISIDQKFVELTADVLENIS